MFNNKRVCIFVDGENLRHSIVNLFSSFSRYDYLPKKANWTTFFDWVAKQVAGDDANLIRTYWYVVENIDFYPYNLNSINKKDIILATHILSKNIDIKSTLSEISNGTEEKFIRNKMNELLDAQDLMNRRFYGWKDIQGIIEGGSKSIEFRRAGAIRYDLFTKQLGSEKAVDVQLATDLIKLKDIYDFAIIVSGDQDYVPAVKAIKDAGKHTVNVSFLTKQSRPLPGGARRLNQSTDWSIEIEYPDLQSHLGFKAKD